ncbi:MAG TPA: glycine betaine ABC transporter substrate-binding protein [Polyangia bacterium]|nr:glycine betaine ABC transporter substrate-binding protein [Polyangia bacterium]
MKPAGRFAAPALVALVACAGGGARASSTAEQPLRVGSKAFPESVILAEAAGFLATAAGTPVDDRGALGGSRLCWDALLAGALDVYPEYTGTLREEILRGEVPAADLDALRAALATHGIAFIGPLGFENHYALAMRAQAAAALHVQAISDLAGHPPLKIGVSNEFLRRRDGWPGLAAHYGLPASRAQGLDHELALRGLAAGALDVVDVYSTDAEIGRDQLRVLTDDRHYFPRYDAILLYRRDAEARWPAAFAAMRRMAGAVDEATMIRLNTRAKIDRVPERTVAADFVAQRFGVRAAAGGEARWRAVWRRLREHLSLVAVSLLAAILCALPLGVLAARRPRLGQVVLAAVGVVQTIPSLALLVFMIPLLGIGSWPAIVALFLYSLLPIVRNTHAGLTAIPGALRESAEALGLPRGAILWRIELPLAFGTILAGIQSAAVINIGTATLGALVGAGGFGQPIFAGIRLDDVSLILEGAIPASVLALVVQALFDLLERVLVPKGLRLDRR